MNTGGIILKPCPRAMTIPGTVAQWEEWAQLRFLQSGDYIIPGALVPVKMDVEQDLGLYVEPNVWVVHAFLCVVLFNEKENEKTPAVL